MGSKTLLNVPALVKSGQSPPKNSHLRELPNRLPQKISVVMPALPHLLSCYAACSSFLFDKPDACLPVSSMRRRRWSLGLLHKRTAAGLPTSSTSALLRPVSSSSPSWPPRQARLRVLVNLTTGGLPHDHIVTDHPDYSTRPLCLSAAR
jgi:hypothetical protein